MSRCRSAADEIITEIRGQHSPTSSLFGTAHVVELDLSSLSSVTAFVDHIHSKFATSKNNYPSILVNNAGMGGTTGIVPFGLGLWPS